MSLRARVLSILGGICVVCLVVLLSLSATLLSRTFVTMDERAARDDIRLFLNVIGREERDIRALCGDWAPWNDTYDFVSGSNDAYVSGNLTLPTLQNIRVDLFCILTPEHTVHYALVMEPNRNRLRPMTAREERDILGYAPFIGARSDDSSASGFISVGGDAFLFASQAILHSDLSGPPRGTLVFGRRIVRERETMVSLTGIQADFLSPDQDIPKFDETKLIKRHGVIDATRALRDPLGRPVLLLSLHSPSNISSDGERTAFLLACGIAVAIILGGLAATLLLLRHIVAPVDRLRNTFEEMESNARIDTRVPKQDVPDLDAVARSVNALLDATEAIFDNADTPMILTDAKGFVVEVNREAERLLGRKRSALRGTALISCFAKETAETVKRAGVTDTRIAGSLLGPEGREISVEIRIVPFDAGLRPLSAVTFRDLTEQRTMEQQLAKMTYTDPLTGLPNRSLFVEEVEAALSSPESVRKGFSLVMIDIDGFKSLNERSGPADADTALHQIAARMQSILSPSDIVSRWGGDEFAILLRSAGAASGLEFFLQRLKTVIETQSSFGGYSTVPSASVGVVRDLSGYHDTGSLFGDADSALQTARSHGTGRTEIFDPERFGRRATPLAFREELLDAIRSRLLVAHYQPIADLQTMRVIGFEALARWKHPQRGMLLPGDFVPIAEETGLIEQIDRVVLADACTRLSQWRSLPGGEGLSISVNFSATEFLKADFAATIIGTITALGAPPDGIVLELTESAMLHDIDSAAAVIERLRDTGLRVALDDFGAGYSSLRYLNRLRARIVKIDRMFTRALPESAGDMGVIRAVIAVSRELGMLPLAEGIETLPQLSWLRENGCLYGQGYLLSRPVDPSVAEAFVGRVLTPSQDDSPA